MADVLARIIERKRVEVAQRLSNGIEPPVPSTRSLSKALTKPGARFIMEIKRASPSGHRSKVSTQAAVAAYGPVTDAISVLTDGADFGGSMDDLRQARRAFDGPILAKDFIVDVRQVAEARAAGADAVLAMLSVLDDQTAAQVMSEARRFGMDTVVEVHNDAELERAKGLGAQIIGINNRDLTTLRVDLAVTERLAPLAPTGAVLISESGVRSRQDVERLAHHVDGFLVGSSLMAAPDIHEAARELVHGRVKLCGITRQSDVELAADSGATHVGFILVPGTPRAVAEPEAKLLSLSARQLGLKTVGVFRDACSEHVAIEARRLRLSAIQLHGSEDAAYIAKLRGRLLPATEIWALCGVGSEAQLPRDGADRSLFDTMIRGRSGGTGRAFDWSIISKRHDLPQAFVAGGLKPANVANVAGLGAYGLDVSSGVEQAPGLKDPVKVRALFEALRARSRQMA